MLKVRNKRVSYLTGKGRKIPIHLKEVTVPIEDVMQFYDPGMCDKACYLGCKNWDKKLSCPPKSPSFSNYARGCGSIRIFMAYTLMKHFNYFNSNGYRKCIVANGILKGYTEKLMTEYRSKLEAKTGKHVHIVSSGSCRKCAKCGPDVCKKPQVRVFSFESLGINVQALSRYCFEHELLWYAKKIIPNYTTVLCGILIPN